MNILFAAFEVFPTTKGSTTRIAYTLHALRKIFTSLTLACLGYGDMPRFQEEDHISIRRCLAMHPNFLKRTELFGDFLFDVLDRMEHNPEVIHFRDVWSGIPLLEHPSTQTARKIFEVNGFASIELPMHYPRLYKNLALLDHLRMMEDFCLAQADHVITVSQTNANYIQRRGVAAEKITVIPNIAEVYNPALPPHRTRKGWYLGVQNPGFAVQDLTLLNGGQEGGNNYPLILYAGTLTPWQGVPTLLKAFALVADREDLRLLLVCSTKKFLKPVRKFIKKLRLKDRVKIKIGLSREVLHEYYKNAVFSVVPLTRCDRNELQGCCPLKILESMAAGTPVIASNLAVCRELIEHGEDGWLIAPDSPRSLAHAMMTLLDNPQLVSTLGQKAQDKISRRYNRTIFVDNLRKVYILNNS